MLKSVGEMQYHKLSEQIVTLLRSKTQNAKSDTYFRVLTAYFFGQMAASMRASVITADRGKIPINTYAMALMTSGAGKGHSLNIMEEEIVNQFKSSFMKDTFKQISEAAIDQEAIKKSVRNSTDYQDELEALTKEFNSYGEMPYSFSEGTGPAFKQARTKAQIATISSLNFLCDEIGSNLNSIQELLTVGLEAYDVGKVKQKLIKNTADNKRAEERDAAVPTNMLLFGTPAKVFNGGVEEKEMLSLLETGYARRLLFGFGNKGSDLALSEDPAEAAEQLYDILCQASSQNNASTVSDYFGNLADPINFERAIPVNRDIGIKLMMYKMECESKADKMPEQKEIHKAEMNHRYFKVLKLMGAYAFVDGTHEVTEDQLYGAIKVVEDSGIAFNEILNRPKPYERLANHLATSGEVTLADLDNDLIYFKGANNKKQELIQMAQAWGYKNNIIIKRYFQDNIEFFKGETLQETDINAMTFSLSNHEAYNYEPLVQPFTELYRMTLADGFHWCTHSFTNKHRNGDNVEAGFNMIVIDCDGTVSLDTAKLLLRDLTYHIYTTKRHTNEEHRFRIILPMKYTLGLNEKEYKDFMANVYEWLPFDTDEGTDQRCKKWLSNNGESFFNDGELFDPRPFIPKTSKNIERQEAMKKITNLDKIERWFVNNELVDGNRNNGLAKYAFMLLDAGHSPESVEEKVKEFNAKLPDPLSDAEISATVVKSLWARASK